MLERIATVTSTHDPTRRNQPRMILIDDNIRDVGGHYFELATLLLIGAEQLGFQGVLATHASFDSPQAVPANWSLRPSFNTRRLVRWSLGVDGDSRYQRDHSGKTIGGSGHQNLWASVTDQFSPPAKRPKPMLRQWAGDLTRLLAEIKPNSTDTLLINTGDDFAMLALAAALEASRYRADTNRRDLSFCDLRIGSDRSQTATAAGGASDPLGSRIAATASTSTFTPRPIHWPPNCARPIAEPTSTRSPIRHVRATWFRAQRRNHSKPCLPVCHEQRRAGERSPIYSSVSTKRCSGTGVFKCRCRCLPSVGKRWFRSRFIQTTNVHCLVMPAVRWRS